MQKKMAIGFFLLFLACLLLTAAVQLQGQVTTAPPQAWTNSPSPLYTVTYKDGSAVRLVLGGGLSYTLPSFAAGFYCASPCESFLFAVFLATDVSSSMVTLPAMALVVWTPNRDRPVHANATLSLSTNDGLILLDADGSLVWSTNTSGKPVGGMTLTDSGNLMLVGRKNEAVWQSFDHPADYLVPGQSLTEGMKMKPTASPAANEQFYFYLTVLSDGLYAFVGSSPPQLYYQMSTGETKSRKRVKRPTYAVFKNGSLDIFVDSSASAKPCETISLPHATSLQYMRLEADGHLRLYEWQQGWAMVQDVLDVDGGDCGYPTVCGEYGICLSGQCTCPFEANTSIAYFRQIDSRRINLGCEPVTAISCQSITGHKLLAFPNVSYFNYIDPDAAQPQLINEESCKQACLQNCSCKAALFMYHQNTSDGSCFLPSRLFSLKVIVPETVRYYSTSYIKVQITQPLPTPSLPTPVEQTSSSAGRRVGVILGSVGGFITFIVFIILFICKQRKRHKVIEEEEELGDLPGMPTRFSFEQLKVATEQFREKLGEGGFGSVYMGQLHEERIAVKHLDRAGQGKKDFLAEVRTIVGIHHVNLVRLIGFCAEKSHRLLVYEYMSKGSLDRWIYYRHGNAPLDWNTRCRIIRHIAKGLSYLHEECRQRIAHLDVKPQNILLDDNFNAKLSDFGLAKLIDRDKSQVITRLRGTPGYLAPEWLTSQITEKADIYSFGVVVMEVIGGRKNLDSLQPEESIHLISLLQEKVKNDQLVDLIDEKSDDMQMHKEEVINMMKLAMWCLQIDCNKRPQMSIVVRVLEGTMDVETDIDYNFVSTIPVNLGTAGKLGSSAPPLASHLSSPR